jgi:hypothetical protein
MHDLINETYQSIKTALHFALKGEEMLYLLCEEKYEHLKDVESQSKEVTLLLEQWRLQKEICERLAKTLHEMNPWYTNGAFDSARMDGSGIGHLLRLPERQKNGTNILPVRKS